MPSAPMHSRPGRILPALALLTLSTVGTARGAAIRPDPDPDFSRILHRCTEPDPTVVFTDNETRTRWSDPSQTITEEFDVYVGSEAAGTDGMQVVRQKANWDYKDFGDGDKHITIVLEGYAIASGTAPILAGRRVRAASDGTQFAIEVIVDPADSTKYIERVYFLNSATGKPLAIRVFASADQNTDELEKELQLELPGQYFELREGAEIPSGPSGTISGKDVSNELVYFAGQMYLLLTSKHLLIEPPKISEAVKAASPKDIAALIGPERRVFERDEVRSPSQFQRTLMARFLNRLEQAPPKDGGAQK